MQINTFTYVQKLHQYKTASRAPVRPAYEQYSLQ